VSPAGYTGGAIELARSTDVSLHDAETVRKWIKNVDRIEKQRASETESETRLLPPDDTPVNEALTEARKRAVWHPHPDDPPTN
jgi:hypothetical protein